MEVRYIKQREAKEFVRKHHRHHSVPSTGAVFTLGLFDADTLHGVAMVGRPVSRELDNGATLEITRLCTDGVANGCSMLYSRCVDVAKALGGFSTVITYTEIDEPGGSLNATAGFICEGIAGAPDWTGGRSRGEKRGVRKLRWKCSLLEERRQCKNPTLSLTKKQQSALIWLNIVRHKLDIQADDIFFCGNEGHAGLVALFPWKSQGQEGIINERLAEAQLPMIAFKNGMDEIMEYVPNATGPDFFFAEEDFYGNYDCCMELCDQMMQDITDYLIRIDLMSGTEYRAKLTETA